MVLNANMIRGCYVSVRALELFVLNTVGIDHETVIVFGILRNSMIRPKYT